MKEQIFNIDNSFKSLGDWLEAKPYSKYFILTDSNTALHCLPLLKKTTVYHIIDASIEVPAGDIQKHIGSCEVIWNTLIENGADRSSLLINLGGGMISDLGGFAASTFMRGIDYINIPTSLLGMVDASIGGKTGLNFKLLKNQIGTFDKSMAVFINEGFLKTLPEIELISGLGEILKYALLTGDNLLSKLERLDKRKIGIDLINDCIKLKQEIVQADFEEKGSRKLLNLGHNFAHAFETYGYKNGKHLAHGLAVANGLIVEAILAKNILGLPASSLKTLYFVFEKFFQKIHVSINEADYIMHALNHDKKNKDGNLRFTLLKEIGDPAFDVIVTKAQATHALHEYIEL